MTIIGSTNNSAWTYKLEVNEIDTSVQDRTSTVRVQVYLGRASSTSYLGGNYSTSVNCGGQSQSENGNISYPTYISGGDWLLLKTFDFVVANENNPTTIAISSTFSSSDFTPSYASANGSMQLTILHINPTIEIAEMVEINQDMIDLSIPDTTIVQFLSQKRITLHATTSDNAVPNYRLEHFNTNYVLPTPPNEYQSSNVFETDYTQNDVVINNSGKAKIIQRVKDSLNGTATDWLYLNINGEKQEPNGIAYTKPTLEFTSTYIKRKSGNGTNLTDNKADLNLIGTFYKNNDIIGNNNEIINIGYKIWEDRATEPSSYITIQNPTISGGNISVSDLEISNVVFTKVYRYKIIIVDKYNYAATTTGKIPIGLPTWTEYQDRIDFLKLTVKGYNPFEYSENETICGEWMGKPLYRQVKVINGRIENGVINIAHNISDVDTIFVNMGKTFLQNEDYRAYPLPVNQYESGSAYDQLGIKVNRTNITFLVQTSWGVDWKVYVTLEYTKTTD